MELQDFKNRWDERIDNWINNPLKEEIGNIIRDEIKNSY